MPVFVESEIDWLDNVRERIDSVFLGELTHRDRFCELRRDVGEKRGKPIGIWGWNTWCGIHDMTPLAWSHVHELMKNTVDEGLSRTERGTGLLPHAIPIDEDGRIGYRNGEEETYYRTYSGIHGEDYCVDNIICWAKMALELFLYTRDRSWFTTEKLGIVEKSTDYILDNLRSDFNPDLIESGIEGDWTENTDWRGDNSNNNVSMIQCLDQLVEVERTFGRASRAREYLEKAGDLRSAFRVDSENGGFWHETSGYFLHGNDGTGGAIYGDEYFESTANYYSLLLDVPDEGQRSRIFSYIDSNPGIESPLPVLTNYLPRNAARRMNYGQTVTDGDVWLTLGAHATAARLRWGYRREATSMYSAIFHYEREHGTIDNAIYMDGTADTKWSPEIGNYGSIFTPLVEGVLGFHPISEGLLIRPLPLEGMNNLKILEPLTYAGKRFYLEISWKGGSMPEATMDGEKLKPTGGGIVLDPEYEDGCKIEMVYR
jgi:hypothetical protein